MKLIFECSTRYLTSECSERIRYRFEHEKRNFISPSLFYKPTNNEVFDDFPEDFQRFENVVRLSYECFRTFSRKFPKIAEEDPKMFRLNIDKLWVIPQTHQQT